MFIYSTDFKFKIHYIDTLHCSLTAVIIHSLSFLHHNEMQGADESLLSTVTGVDV